MKKLAVTLCLSAIATGAFAQGFINFFNNSSTLVTTGIRNDPASYQTMSGTPGSYYFQVLTAPTGTTDPTAFTPVGATFLGTNQAVAGRFNGGANIQIQGWAGGTTLAFEVIGWSASLGANVPSSWKSWITNPNAIPVGSYFGASAMGSGAAGPGSPAPALNIFGASPSINSGFLLLTNIPEPSTFALAGLGAAAMLIFRRRK